MIKSLLLFLIISIFLSITILCLAEEKLDLPQIQPVIKSPSSIGEVAFKHQEHVEEHEVDCNECHHETQARVLEFEHKYYNEDLWTNCKNCHQDSQDSPSAKSCSFCHHSSDTVGDETQSAKVVIHINCNECHDSEEGQEASSNCKFCHSGPKSDLEI